ncbi:MAG: ABC transporter permease [Clostridiales bacterium]|nr:ABC transporter permease [Clostridiales bacterium]
MKAIYRRELASFANGMIGSICVAFMLACVGLYFMAYNLLNGYPSFAIALYYALFLFLIAIPLLCMRVMSEDRHNRTDQLLLTSPVTVTGMVLGKFFAVLTVFAVPCVLFAFCPLIMKIAAGSSGEVYFLTDYCTLLCFFVLGAAYISIGILISAATESQVIAAVGTFGILLVLHLWDSIVSFLPTTASGSFILLLIASIAIGLLLDSLTSAHALSVGVGGGLAVITVACYLVDSSWFESLVPNILSGFSFTGVLLNFAEYQVFDIPGVLMLLSVTALMLFLTVQVIQRRRWH